MLVEALLTGLIAAAPAPAAGDPLAAASAALADFRPEDALEFLDEARGPHLHERHVRLYEHRGIALAYLDRGEEAVEAFQRMLALEPDRVLSYTLSPKVTFLFERARRAARAGDPPALDLSWPRNLRTVDAIPVDVEVLSDPLRFLSSLDLRYRVRGDPKWATRQLELPDKGRFVTVGLPAVAAGADGPRTVELYAVATDGVGNEVLLFGRPDRPRDIELRYEPPDPWFEQWWVWAAAGAVVAASATAIALSADTSAAPTVDGRFRVP